MRGTIVNVTVVLLTAVFGLLLRRVLRRNIAKENPPGAEPAGSKYEEAIRLALGLVAIPLGVSLFLETQNPLIVLFCVPAGLLWGRLWSLHDRLASVGEWLGEHARFLEKIIPSQQGDKFTDAFVTATTVSLIGPLAVMGPIRAGTVGDYTLLYQKCIFDGFATTIFAVGLGNGVLFSAIPILLFQGTITLIASWIEPLLTQAMIADMTAVGGVLIMAMGVHVAGIRKIKTGDFLPAIFLAPIVTYLWILVPV